MTEKTKMDGLIIRKFEFGDQEAVVRLWEDCGLVFPQNDPLGDIARKVRFQRDHFLVASLQGRIVGTLMAGYEGRRGWINGLAVMPSFQRKGIGRELVLAAESRLRSLGCPKVNLLVRTSNSEVIEFYEKLGFIRDDAVCLGKRLPEEPPGPTGSLVIRPPRPGDFGWVVHRHGALYAEEYRWTEEFEGLVADIVGKFIRERDSRREGCWIAESGGEIVGSVFLAKESPDVAKLRLLFVEPKARGMGIGTRLVEECLAFARQGGYRQVRLWTNDVLHAARHIYEKAGFRMVCREPHRSFGHDLVGETWELKL